jgi:hypothetical protein
MADPFRPDQGANYALDGWVDGILKGITYSVIASQILCGKTNPDADLYR